MKTIIIRLFHNDNLILSPPLNVISPRASVYLLTASTRLLALPLFCKKREQLSAGNCRRDGDWLRLGEPSRPSVYHKLLFTAVGMLPTLPELRQST